MRKLTILFAFLFLFMALFMFNTAFAHDNEQEHHEELHEDGTCEHAMEMVHHHSTMGHPMCEGHNQFPRG